MRTSLIALSAFALLAACRTDGKVDPGQGNTDTGALASLDEDGDGFAASEDCDDTDASVNAGATEICDGIDNDCDGEIDEGVTSEWYADEDGDGYGDPDAVEEACSQPPGASSSGTDCDDTDPTVNPTASERCDEIDNNCDGNIDEDVRTTWWVDADGDGYGDPDNTIEDCDPDDGTVDNSDDCDDTTAAAAPDADEICDEIDNDCDGTIDEDDALDAATWYADNDGDGWGANGSAVVACEQPSATVSIDGDCDDVDFDINPAAQEICDGVDNDCNSLVDDDDAGVDLSTGSAWYTDADADTYGDAGAPVAACVQPAGTVTDATDCDDANAAVNPGEQEVCNSIDDDCDGATDDADASVDTATGSTFYRDADSDGFGNASSPIQACVQPAGAVSDSTDCDDTAAAVNPGAQEVCNGIDDDCDTSVDDADSSLDTTTGLTFYTDVDSDGYGDASSAVQACTQPTGTVSDATDCDDSRAATNPGAAEYCNSIDDDCDGTTDENTALDATTWYVDSDSDTYGDPSNTVRACTQPSGAVSDATDCDDSRAATNPGAAEYCNSIDDDCDGTTDENTAVDATTWYRDGDNDNYGDASNTVRACSQPSGAVADSTDCDDSRATTNPGASEYCNSRDDDCDGTIDESSAVDAVTWYRDTDSDNYGDPSNTVRACSRPSGAVSNAQDCDDGDSAINPAATEVCDSQDNDCDGVTDPDFESVSFANAASVAGMSLNGNASRTSGILRITPASANVRGTALFSDTIPGTRWYASFDFRTGGGSGADGLTFAFLNPSTAATAQGSSGGGMGFFGLSGYAVEFDTYDNGGIDPNGNHASVVSGGGTAYQTSSSIPTLENTGWHLAEIYYNAGQVQLYIDGSRYLNTTVTGTTWSSWRMGVTAATGSATNYHDVDDLVIGCY